MTDDIPTTEARAEDEAPVTPFADVHAAADGLAHANPVVRGARVATSPGAPAPASSAAAAGTVPWLIQLGDAEHGVARYSRQVADAVASATGESRLLALDAALAAPVDRAHVHFTDRLWGSTPELAATAFERLAATTSLTVTLHDVPQNSDGPTNLPRRVESYARVMRAASGVVCNSGHEALLLAEFVDPAVAVEVIPLPVDGSTQPDPQRELDHDVALVGFVYPGKGHSEALDAVAKLGGDRPAVVALGKASPGHEPDLDRLHDYAAERGVLFGATGFLADDELLDRCRRAGVPLAAHQHVSASGSLATWISAGRRPLVPNTRYSREMAALRPGTVTLYEPSTLTDAIRAALRDPASTWLDAGTGTGPTTSDVAEHYRRWWNTVAW